MASAMAGKKCCILLSLLSVATPAPYDPMFGNSELSEGYEFPKYTVVTKNSRGFWDFLGDWIQGSDWFPIEFNIPDTIGSIGTGFSNFANGIIQRIPFLNNNNDPNVVKPMHNRLNATKGTDFTKAVDGSSSDISINDQEASINQSIHADAIKINAESTNNVEIITSNAVSTHNDKTLSNFEQVSSLKDLEIANKEGSQIAELSKPKTQEDLALETDAMTKQKIGVGTKQHFGLDDAEMLQEDGISAYL